MFPNINSVDARRSTFHIVGRDQFNADQMNLHINNQTGAMQCYSCTFTVYTHLPLELLQLLNSVPDAMYDSIRSVSRCLEGTHQEIIGKIIEWVDGGSDQPIC